MFFSSLIAEIQNGRNLFFNRSRNVYNPSKPVFHGETGPNIKATEMKYCTVEAQNASQENNRGILSYDSLGNIIYFLKGVLDGMGGPSAL